MTATPRVRWPVGALGAILLGLSACGGGDGGGVIEDNLVRPGVTAIEEASDLACNADVEAVRTALESYELLEGAPADDETALVTAGYLREPSELVDVVDGRIVAADPGCEGAVNAAASATATTAPDGAPLTAPATDVGEIVTSVEPGPAQMTTDEVLATMTELDVATYGGVECATEIAAISAAGQAFVVREGRNPDSLSELAGDLDREIALWAFDAENQALVPAPGSSCPDVFSDSVEGQQAAACSAERGTLEVAVEAYLAQEGAPPVDEQAIIDAGLLQAPVDAYDLDATGAVVPAPDSPCT